jgi:CheY-like chemotaxis protein
MTQEVADRAFMPFFTTKEVGQGTGLGLSVVHGFAQQSGGGVQIESSPGRGTTVRLDLPAAAPETPAVAANDDAVKKMPKGGRVLLVEDDVLVRASAAEALERLGYLVETAESAPVALRILERSPASTFDLVLSDVVMPDGISGAELAREVKLRWPGTRVLLTSGYAAETMQGRMALPEGVDLLGKPYSNADLVRAINKACA